MDTEKSLEEVQRIVEDAANGYWIPLAIVSTLFGVIILLLLHIWRQNQKTNRERHERNEKMIEGVSKTLKQVSETMIELRAKESLRSEMGNN